MTMTIPSISSATAPADASALSVPASGAAPTAMPKSLGAALEKNRESDLAFKSAVSAFSSAIAGALPKAADAGTPAAAVDNSCLFLNNLRVRQGAVLSLSEVLDETAGSATSTPLSGESAAVPAKGTASVPSTSFPAGSVADKEAFVVASSGMTVSSDAAAAAAVPMVPQLAQSGTADAVAVPMGSQPVQSGSADAAAVPTGSQPAQSGATDAVVVPTVLQPVQSAAADAVAVPMVSQSTQSGAADAVVAPMVPSPMQAGTAVAVPTFPAGAAPQSSQPLPSGAPSLVAPTETDLPANQSAVPIAVATSANQAVGSSGPASGSSPSVPLRETPLTVQIPLPAEEEEESPSVVTQAPQAAPIAVPETVDAAPAPVTAAPVASPEAIVRAAAAEAPSSAVLVEAAEAVADSLLVSPGLLRGDAGEVRILLKPDVLGGSEVRLTVDGGTLGVAFHPATEDLAAKLEACRPQLEAHLAERIHSFQIAVRIRKEKSDDRA